ncbi:MAG TPA: hypothetical protein VKR82_05975 [Candidatus Acidoferrales bacterium]|nr:hypothetical protein [Candidatus Acidoferrales bacterium]
MKEPTVKAKPQLILYDTDSAVLENLEHALADLPYISFEVGNGPQVCARAHLDAIWATIMVGLEVFGAQPPFPLHEARVLLMPSAQLECGMPKYGVVGVAVSKDDPTTPEFNLRLVLSVLLRTVKSFNSQRKDQIERVGILPDDLDLRKLDPARAHEIIQEVYERFGSD